MKVKINIFFFIFVAAFSLLATDYDVEIRPANEDVLISKPNQNVTTVLHVTNHTDQSIEFVSDVELPQDWKLITRELPYGLEAHQVEMKLLSFLIPQGTAVGRYEVMYRVRGREFPSISGHHTLYVDVQEYREYSMLVTGVPEIAIAGDLIQFHVFVENKSNVADSLCIQHKQFDDSEIYFEASSFVLEAGSTRKIKVRIQTNQEITRDLNALFELKLFCHGCQQLVDVTKFSIRLISRIQGSSDVYFKLPVELTAAFVTQKVDGVAANGFQGDILGAGSLDQENKHRIQFHLRGPDAYQKALSIYAERDQFFTQYQNDRFQISIGDRPYTLSTLTQNSSYGRGAEFGIKLTPKWYSGVYYQKNRWFIARSRSTAGYLRYRITPSSFLQANIMTVDHKDRSGTVLSLVGKSQWGKNRAQIEYAADQDGGRTHHGFEAGVSGSPKFVSYNVRWVYADPEFSGYYRDTNYLSTSLAVKPTAKIGVRVLYRSERQNFELDTTRFSAPITKYFQAGLIYNKDLLSNLTFDYINQSRKDRLFTLFNYREQSFRLRYAGGFKNINFSATAEGGITKNEIYDRDATMSRYTASLFYEPRKQTRFRGFLYLDHNNRYSGEKQKILTAGLQIQHSIGDRLSLSLHLQNNHDYENYYYDRNQSELGLRYQLPNGHVFRLRGRRTLLKRSLNRTDMAVVAEYKAPLSIPISRKPNTCVVIGKIYDAQTQLPLKDQIVRINGSTAVSNEEGIFRFRNLSENTYYLSVDKGTMGLNRVTVQRIPMEVRTIPGKEGIFIEIGVVDGASVTGRVLLQSIPEEKTTDENGFIMGTGDVVIEDTVSCENGEYGLSAILVEMKRGGEILRRMTGDKGEFNFEELRPGRWTVKFYNNNLPNYHQFEQDSYEVDIEPGESKIVNGCVVPKKRRIRFMQGGDQVLHEKFQPKHAPQ